MIAIARVADGWWIGRDWWVENAGGIKLWLKVWRKLAATVWGCCVGEPSGEDPARDERSEAELNDAI